MLVSLLTLGCPEQLSGGYLYHCRLAELAGDHDAEVEFVPVRLWPDPFTLAHGDVLLVDSIAAWLVRRTGPPPPRPGHAPPRRPGRRRAGLHRAGPGPPRRPRRPGRAPRRARPGRHRLPLRRRRRLRAAQLAGTVRHGLRRGPGRWPAGRRVAGWQPASPRQRRSRGSGPRPGRCPGPRRRTRPAGQRRAVAGRRGAALPRWSHTAATLFAALKELTASAR